MTYHGRPIIKYAQSRFTKGVTPYHMTIGEASGWRIGFGASSYLVAKGSGFSRPHGMKLLRSLEDDWRQRRKARRPKKK